MEKLTKQQIVLVTLLVSFVTSIATGIVTVALMDQAPPGVTQTINRVVERTIEKVVTEPANNSAAVITRETIVVKEDEKIVESIEQNKNSVVKVSGILRGADPVLLGGGLLVSKDGVVLLGINPANQYDSYMVRTSVGVEYTAKLIPKDNAKITLVKIELPAGDSKEFIPVKFADSNALKLGQTIIVLGGEKDVTAVTGIISNLSYEPQTTNATSTEIAKVNKISANVTWADTVLGSPILNLYGEVIGVRVDHLLSSDKVLFTPANVLQAEITARLSL